MENNKHIFIKQNIYRHLFWTLLSIAITLASLHFLFGDFSDMDSARKYGYLIPLSGMCGSLFFGTASIYLIYRLFKFKYLLIITTEGFYDYSTMGAIGFVSWSEVTKVWLVVLAVIDGKSQQVIGVKVKDNKKLLVGQPWYKLRLIKADISHGYPPITINLNSAKENIDDVILVMNKYWDEWKKNNESNTTS